MKVAIYGGSFNPPHLGHTSAAADAVRVLQPDILLVIPAREPPHKTLPMDTPSPEDRLELCREAFSCIPCACVSDMELRREEVSYTVDTVRALRQAHSDAELYLLMGTDMLESFESWRCYEEILHSCVLAVFCRAGGEMQRLEAAADALRKKYGTRVLCIPHEPREAASNELRAALRRRELPDVLARDVYREIIRKRHYGAKPNLAWLREQAYVYLKPKRVPHVQGTEAEAVRLAKRWGADEGDAAEAAILHDITKKEELPDQLLLCEKYGIINDTSEMRNGKLLHAKTGAALSRELFGVTDAVYDAIRWHTTGRAGMSLLEKIIYMADYIEPTRDFPGLEKLRRLAYEDLDRAMILGLEMSLEDLRSYGIEPHVRSLEALESLRKTVAQG